MSNEMLDTIAYVALYISGIVLILGAWKAVEIVIWIYGKIH